MLFRNRVLWLSSRWCVVMVVVMLGFVILMNWVVFCVVMCLSISLRFGKCLSSGLSIFLMNMGLWLNMFILGLVILLCMSSGNFCFFIFFSVWK